MNKSYIFSAGLLAALLSLNSCSENQELPAESGKQMTFDILHPKQKTATRVTETAFEANDRIGLFISEKETPLEVSGNYVNNAALTFSGGQWNAEKPVYWNDGTYNAYAYYPYASPVTSVDDYPFSVATDQNGNGYTASDFLYASKTGITASNSPVALQFSHRMSRLMVKLIKGEDYEGDLPDDAEVYVHNTVPSATIDLSAGVVTRNPHGTSQSIRAKSLGGHKYTAIVVPQRLDNRQPLVEVIMKGVSYLYESKFLFKPGIQHTVQLAVSKNPEQIKIEIGGEIENWE